MKPSIQRKLEALLERHEEISALLNDAETMTSQDKFRELSKEYAHLEPVVNCFRAYNQCLADSAIAEELRKDGDPEMRAMAEEELSALKIHKEQLAEQLQLLLLPRDPNDNRNVYLEIRAGAGGDEAAIFVGDLFRMYSRYAEAQGWHVEVMHASASERGGYKEMIAMIAGQNVYAKLKFESGAHRVQRVPETEAQGRIHTSTCTVAVMPEAEEIGEIEINPADLKVDTYRASGAGGQHVNRTESAIRITHIPSGVVVECQDERSQHKNRARAMAVLSAKLLAAEQSKQQTEQAETRRNLVGTGDRSERIRTYNFPQGRLTDHRINLTLYKLEAIMGGHLADVIEPLIREHQADQLAAMAGE